MLVEAIQKRVKNFFTSKEGSHDWYHIERVWKLSLHIHQKEGGNREIVELCALLHDVSDHKFNGGDFELGGSVARQWVLDSGGSLETADKVGFIVPQISFKGALVKDTELPIEGLIVRDADRLDAIGAIGIARAFAYGGSKNRPLFDPKTKPEMHSSKEAYLESRSHTVNHFYEKLLRIKDRISTKTAKNVAQRRHLYMEGYLKQFYDEWNVNLD